MEIRPDTVVVQSRDPVAVEVDQAVVMMGLEQGKYYGLEGVGGRIWSLIEEPRSVRAVCDVLVAEYEVERGICLREVTSFLTEMAREKLVRVADEASSPVPPAAGG